MISPKKLIKMKRKWQRRAALGRKIISSPRTNTDMDAGTRSTSGANKGHFVFFKLCNSAKQIKQDLLKSSNFVVSIKMLW